MTRPQEIREGCYIGLQPGLGAECSPYLVWRKSQAFGQPYSVLHCSQNRPRFPLVIKKNLQTSITKKNQQFKNHISFQSSGDPGPRCCRNYPSVPSKIRAEAYNLVKMCIMLMTVYSLPGLHAFASKTKVKICPRFVGLYRLSAPFVLAPVLPCPL